jgi:HTH-type transcriptional regulator, sugar sensing transcriptional regulator
MHLQKLKQIGLTEGEIKVYQALLNLGECTKTKLAKESNISPSNIYDVTNRLLEKGIISKVEKNGIAHFSPANPKHILDFLDTKKQEIKKEEDIVNSILPNLMQKFSKTKEKVNIEVFQGWNGLKTIFEDLLEECKKGDKNYIFGASKGEKEQQADIFFLKYSKAREKKGIQTKIIFNEELKQTKRIKFFLKSKKYQVKFLQQSTPTEIMLYKEKSCIIILSKEPLVIRISGKEVTDSFKQYFEILWKNAKN